ncbi:MAG: hypothetical protein NVSMB1_02010 [Polyangiales bacterium]
MGRDDFCHHRRAIGAVGRAEHYPHAANAEEPLNQPPIAKHGAAERTSQRLAEKFAALRAGVGSHTE